MRTLTRISFLTLLALVLVAGTAFAIGGQCSNCHTMHNSQDGAAVNAAGNADNLLSAGCVACHTGATGQKATLTNAPIVLHTTDPVTQGNGKTNAGGSFYWVDDDGGAADSKGHNVVGISNKDVKLPDGPPGFDASATTGVTFDSKTLAVAAWTADSQELTCAGTRGCHGTRDAADFGGIKGAHHNNTDVAATQATAPTTVGNSFRFLAGIKGLEDANWEYNAIASTHNEYYGKADNGSYGDKGTISYLCAECHGAFHADIGRSSSPWTRHPTDIVLPASSEYNAYTAYSVEAPVARASLVGLTANTVTPGTDIVMCLSCHRAHGTPEPDLLRWTYTGMVAGGTSADTGCFTCHTSKNVAP